MGVGWPAGPEEKPEGNWWSGVGGAGPGLGWTGWLIGGLGQGWAGLGCGREEKLKGNWLGCGAGLWGWAGGLGLWSGPHLRPGVLELDGASEEPNRVRR